MRDRRVALFLPSLAGGGVARSFLLLASGFRSRGFRVDLVLCNESGPYLDQVDDDIRVVVLTAELGLSARRRAIELSPGARHKLVLPILLALSAAPALPYIVSLARYLESNRPDALLAGKTHANLVAIWAKRLAGADTRLVVSERTHLSAQIAASKKWRWRYVAPLISRVYHEADAITSVSDGVAEDLAATTNLPRARITTIYNPVARPGLLEKAREPVDHAWFADASIPVILAVGRLVEQKQYPVLIEAFAAIRAQRPARLLILGEGRNRAALEEQVRTLGLEGDVDMPGFVENPYAYMARAAAFVLASAWEGLPGALIEALVCGCPVVSSDCPSGPREILDSGRFGPLVPVGDASAMASAIMEVLDHPPDRELLRARGSSFSLKDSVERYLGVLYPAGLQPIPTRQRGCL